MEINDALNIFDISHQEISKMGVNELKKIYKKLALKYHPDKNNNSDDSKQYFQEVALAYDTLTIYIESNQDNNMNFKNNTFLDKIFININYFYSKHEGLVKNIIEMYNGKILLHLEKTIYDMNDAEIQRFKTLIDNKNIEQHISSEIKTLIETELKNRNQEPDISKNIEKLYISATIDDIIDNNVRIIEHNNIKIFIPLWHSELIYEVGDENEVLNVYIEPNIPSNMYLDEYNNIHVYIRKDFSDSLLYCDTLDFEIGKKTFNYNIRDIKIEKTQQLIIDKQGPPIINEHNIFAVSHRASIIVHLEFK